MIIEKLNKIIELLTEAGTDAEKCDNGNASAGRRLRKVAMASIKELKELRAKILEKNK